MSASLSVIDPAFGEADGHHAGFAAMLAETRPPARRVRLWCHRKTTGEAAQPLRAGGIEVETAFSSHYYRHFGKAGNTATLASYINRLAQEYVKVHEQLNRDQQPHSVLYHTVSWEHAAALSVALLREPPPARVQHRVLLMFNPGISHRGQTFDPKLRLNYRVALASLARLSGVRLYAGCSEHAQTYARLLERPDPLPIHPSIVGAWHVSPPSRPAAPLDAEMRQLLYVGDAKVDKGFLGLPQTVTRLQPQCGQKARFVVQYNKLPRWASNELRETERELQALAAKDRRLELHCGFWPHEALMRQLAQAHLLVLNYDPQEYAEKTSGLLWFAAWHELPTLLPKGWLQREAERLGLPHGPCSALNNLAGWSAKLKRGTLDSTYRKALFTPLWNWLDES